MRGIRSVVAVALGIIGGFFATDVAAAAPTVSVQVSLGATTGGAVSDGIYAMTFSIYASEQGGSALWTEVHLGEEVKGGLTSVTLGATDPQKPLTPALFAANAELWLGVKIFAEPELTRVRLGFVPRALHALVADSAKTLEGGFKGEQLSPASVGADKVNFTYAGAPEKGGAAFKALDLQCTGCVSVSEIDFDGDLELNGHNVIGANVLSANAFIGDGSKLTGLKVPAGKCDVGKVASGIQTDGSLVCADLPQANLPPDGIKTVSNGLIANQFVDKYTAAGMPLPIKDYFPPGVSSEIVVPDVGIAQNLTVSIDVSNSDFSSLVITLYAPDLTEYLLFSKGSATGNLKATYPDPTPSVSGNLAAWKGKAPTGKWVLKAVDTGFKDGNPDGAVNSWQINVQTLSSKKIQVSGDVLVDGGLQVGGDLQLGGTFTCTGCVTAADLAPDVGPSLMPTGAIVPFALSSCPKGWLAADGTNGTPDLRGRFPIGAGPLPQGGSVGVNDGGGSHMWRIGAYNQCLSHSCSTWPTTGVGFEFQGEAQKTVTGGQNGYAWTAFTNHLPPYRALLYCVKQ